MSTLEPPADAQRRNLLKAVALGAAAGIIPGMGERSVMERYMGGNAARLLGV